MGSEESILQPLMIANSTKIRLVKGAAAGPLKALGQLTQHDGAKLKQSRGKIRLHGLMANLGTNVMRENLIICLP